MKKLFIMSILFLFAAFTYAQEAKPVKVQEVKPLKVEKDNTAINELKAERDTAKSQLRQKTLENTKDINKLLKLENNNRSLKEQLKTAKKSKKSDKAESIQTKITDNTQTLKELDASIKAGEKEIDKLEKDLKSAEKALKTAKEKK